MVYEKLIPIVAQGQSGRSRLENRASKCDASKYPIFSIEDAKKLFGGRKIFIWGAGQKGRGFLLALRRCGFDAESFVDSDLSLQSRTTLGLATISPESFFAENSHSQHAFVLLATVDIHIKQMIPVLEAHGFRKGVSFESIQTLSPFYPTVEVTGLCNLKCSGCIRSDKSRIEAGDFMSFLNYEKVASKLVREIPFLYFVDLYVLGEPLLNKELPEMIRLNNELGLASGLSTNLNNIKNLPDVLREKPALIRVSLSGASSETYDKTHTGGRWTKVSGNLVKLADLIRENGNATIVEVYMHLYKHNLHEAESIRDLCRDYGFRFHPSLGLLLTTDFALQYSRGQGVSDCAKTAHDLSLIPMDQLLEDCRKQSELGCLLTRIVPVVNWDLSVMPCCNYTYKELLPSFLDTPLHELIAARTHSETCMTCQDHSLHRWNNQGYYAEFVRGLVGQHASGLGA